MTKTYYTIRSKWLGSALLKIRKQAGLTIDDVSERMRWPQSKISRIENGMVRAHWGDIQDLLDLYEFHDPDQRKAIITLAKTARERGWWHAYGATLNHPFADLVTLETTSREICTFQNQVVPGLLQTKEYAQAVVGASKVWEHHDEVDKFVQIRTARHAILTRDEPVSLWAILGEAVLRQQVAGPKVMRDQLHHLMEMASLPHVTIQILPFNAGATTGMFGPFTTLKFPSPGVSEVIYLENLTGGLYLEHADAVRKYALAFNHLRASALPTKESMELIATTAKGL
ncbi:helix-turn-helix transcriptional regulator [Thermopolyspora sp. NPDC052614]|uniref:helix-turn-helix domain-containing protein n=1 Tax=Thermopolyspora sp. NPDC052614 TaxID=3155682 RepID=UPI00343305B8